MQIAKAIMQTDPKGQIAISMTVQFWCYSNENIGLLIVLN